MLQAQGPAGAAPTSSAAGIPAGVVNLYVVAYDRAPEPDYDQLLKALLLKVHDLKLTLASSTYDSDPPYWGFLG